MLTEARVSNLVLYASDLEASRVFYGQTLGLGLLTENASAATYAAGGVSLEIRSAAADKITLAGGRDDTSLIVFHVNNLDRMRSRLSARGIQFGQTLRYEIGATVAFYDPDGHNLTLYEPSPESMTWPSAKKIMELVGPGANSDLLRDRPVIYLFLFVRDAKEAFDFYHGKLALRVLEEDPEAGVVKYDCQNIILATHVVGGDARCAVDMDLSLAKGVAAAFGVEDTEAVYRQLSGSNIPFRQFEENPLCSAYFKDPNGHPIFVRSVMTNGVTEPAPA